MRIIMLGAPGAGKGTQAQFLARYYNIPLISTGAIFRKAMRDKTPLGLQIEDLMNSGHLVPDEVVIDLVKERLTEDDCKDGCILDGFPRTIPQAKTLTASDIEIDFVIEIQVGDKEIVKRLTGRLMHPASGRVYHTIYNPPQNDGVDDVTGEPLITRDDDKEETVRKRLEVYHVQTEPLINYYKELNDNVSNPRFVQINGEGSLEEIAKNITNTLNNLETV